MPAPADTPERSHAASRWDRSAGLATIALAVLWLARLVPQALAARLQTDECFHAWVSRWVAVHGALPDTIPGLYGGFAYFYPPLFHLVGGFATSLGGASGFLLVNVAVTALLLLVVALGARRLGAPAAARWGVALCVANSFLAMHTVRLYVEDLSTLLVVAASLRLAGLLREPRAGDALALGLATGLAIVAKLSALVLPPGVALFALVALLRGRRAVAGALAGAAAVACAVAAPWLAHVAARFGTPLYPAMGRDVHPLLMHLNVTHYTPAPADLWREMLVRSGPALGVFALAALVACVRRRRGGIELGLAACCAGLVALAPLQSMLASRHLLPLVISAGVLVAVALDRATAGLPRARRAADLAALGFATWAVLAAFDAVRAHVPAGETVLARETYDVLWYADRPATWPVPFGQKDPPLAALTSADPDTIAADLARHGIRWVLLTDDAGPRAFDGGDWPQPAIDGIAALVATGRAREVWRAEDHSLVRLGP